MKKVFFALMMGLAVFACTPAEYDDTAIKEQIDNLDDRLTKVEEDLATLELNVAGMKTLAEALKTGKYVESVVELEDGTGYTITFSDETTIVVKHGEKGATGEKGDTGATGATGAAGEAGKTPTVTVKDVDGVLYWFINGEQGPAVYEEAPVFTSEDGNLYVTYPDGTKEYVGTLTGKSIFDSVVPNVEEGTVTFTFVGENGEPGDSFVLPLAEAFSLEIATSVGLAMDQTEVEIPYTVKGANATTVVDVLAVACEAVVEAEVIKVSNIATGAQMLVFADNGEGKTSIKKVVFASESYSVEAVDYVIPGEGGEVVVKGVSNVHFEVVIPADATWLTQVVAKSAFELTFAAEKNEGEERSAKVDFVRQGTEEVLMSVTIAQPSAKPFAERVAAYYSNGTAAWCSFIPGIANRTMASDGKYVYLQSSDAAPKVYAVEVASLLAGDETPTYKELSTTNMDGGTHGVSALRCIPNEAGDPILIATNLASDSQNFNIYAYSNGTDADPVLFHAYRWDGVANVSDWRRYGDRIAVSGTWQNGKIYAASQSGTKVMAFGIKDGATSSDQREYCWFDTFGGGLAEVVVYPGTTEAILTTATSAGFWTPNTAGEKHSGGFWPKWDVVSTNPELSGAFSFQFFTHNEKKYIAYVQLPDNTHCDLVVVEDLGSFAASLAAEPVFTAPLYEGEEASCSAGNTYGDCAVVEVDGALHIVAQMQGGGLSIFKLN